MPPDHYAQCPKCGHAPPKPLPASARCPACGIYFFKWERAQAPRANETGRTGSGPRLRDWARSLLDPLDRLHPAYFYGRCLALLLLAVWSWRLYGYDYRYAEINGSFMHNILLPIHEAGHVFFRVFGEFMSVLGGSLFQLLLPFGIGVAFVVRNRDNVGAAIALWWTGASLLDLSPYIYDALVPRMILLGGRTGEDGGHDWIYLLGAFGDLRNAQQWGSAAHLAGGLLILVSLGWAAVVLWKQRERLGDGD
ncbi:hypothetical protein SVA_2579 [Sulfurifustis variabilis]|uniref:Uncharacterized protein n=1 Tax=Sulfurifustis variabilis TaxID=1675686 RepID=A0A1B4VEM1_9GAMM|nr:hypothetical protein [Sulfurifustis variabilis]BAU49127.1 hypothetical protein SVA_2579 [Sulfurifustis variabilis]